MKIKIEINGEKIWADRGKTILEVAKENGIEIPNLCNHPKLTPNGACRLCLVEIKGEKKLATSCSYPVEKEIEVFTETEKLRKIRKTILELLISNHPLDCMTCEKSGDCLLEKYAYEYGIKKIHYEGEKSNPGEKGGKPFIIRDYNKCVLCGRCVKVCDEIVGAEAIDFGFRGFRTQIVSGFDEPLKEGGCLFCGNCIEVCPVGVLRELEAEGRGRTWEYEKVRTVCPYCGVGCNIEVYVKNNEIVKVKGVAESPVNNGWLCVKGKFGFEYVKDKERLKKPLIKENGKFREAEWGEAIDLVADKFKEIKEKYGSDSLAGLSSAKCTNEENYLFQKFFRQIIKTNNVDHCARLCHASTIAGLVQTIGSAAMSNSLEEIENVSDCILTTGANVSETQPVTSYKIRKAVSRGAKLIIIDPKRIELAEIADIYLQPNPGTDVLVFNSIGKIILEEKLYDKKFIEERVENFDEYMDFMEGFSLQEAEKKTGIKIDDLRKVAEIFAKSKSSVILWAMGITQHTTGTDNVMVLSNLALLTGQIGKEGAGTSPLRGQNNVQGACDMGALSEFYPGYQKVEKKETVEKFKKLWDEEDLPDKVGLSVVEIFKAGFEGKIKCLYIMGENPLISDPDISHVEEGLGKIDFVVVQDIFLTETGQFADVVLPAVSSFEKEGTFTNTERRVQKILKCVEPPGEARPDWEIITEIARKLGYKWNYENVWDITDEISRVVAIYRGITSERILKGEFLQWPCPDKSHHGTKTLHKGKFSIGKGKLKCVEYKPPFEMPDKKYPFILTTGRILTEYHTRTMTGKVKGLSEITGKPFCVLNEKDAFKLKVNEGDKIEVSSRRGRITVSAKISRKVKEGTVFIPFHFGANLLTHSKLDKVAKIPEFKICACNVKKK